MLELVLNMAMQAALIVLVGMFIISLRERERYEASDEWFSLGCWLMFMTPFAILSEGIWNGTIGDEQMKVGRPVLWLVAILMSGALVCLLVYLILVRRESRQVPTLTPIKPESKKFCPKCGAEYDSKRIRCSDDGSLLKAKPPTRVAISA